MLAKPSKCRNLLPPIVVKALGEPRTPIICCPRAVVAHNSRRRFRATRPAEMQVVRVAIHSAKKLEKQHRTPAPLLAAIGTSPGSSAGPVLRRKFG